MSYHPAYFYIEDETAAILLRKTKQQINILLANRMLSRTLGLDADLHRSIFFFSMCDIIEFCAIESLSEHIIDMESIKQFIQKELDFVCDTLCAGASTIFPELGGIVADKCHRILHEDRKVMSVRSEYFDKAVLRAYVRHASILEAPKKQEIA